jgi:hypothetical protein
LQSYSTKANHHLSIQFSIQWVSLIFEKVVIGKKNFNGFLNLIKNMTQTRMNNIPEYQNDGGSLVTLVFRTLLQ